MRQRANQRAHELNRGKWCAVRGIVSSHSAQNYDTKEPAHQRTNAPTFSKRLARPVAFLLFVSNAEGSVKTQSLARQVLRLVLEKIIIDQCSFQGQLDDPHLFIRIEETLNSPSKLPLRLLSVLPNSSLFCLY